MPAKINRKLIPLILIALLSLGRLPQTSAQSPDTTIFFPIITNNPSQWIGPYGGTIVAIAIDPSNPQIVYAGSYGSGVYKSLDGGNTWSPASRGLTNLFVYSLAIDPAHPATVYAGTYHGQIFKSVDGGGTWSWSGQGMQEQAIVYDIAIDPYLTYIIYAATRGISNNGNAPWSGVVYKSIDAGSTWTPSLQNLGGPGLQDWVYSIMVNPNARNEVLIAAHESGPLRSDNYGANWYPINNGIQDYSGRSIVVSPQAGYGDTYYYGVWHTDSIYKSTDRGSSWFTANQGIANQQVYTIALDAQDVNNVFLATFSSGILKSTNGGSTWQVSGLTQDNTYALVINPFFSNRLLAGTGGDGLFHSDDAGENWYRGNTGINNAMVTAVVIDPTNSNQIYASVYGEGVFSSMNRGESWDEINSGLSDLFVLDLVMDPAQQGLLFALTDQGGLYKNDLYSGNGWVSTGSGLPITSINQPTYPADHPFATLEMQEAFANQSVSTSSGTLSNATLVKMVFAPANPDMAYLGTVGAGVYRSINGGRSWQAAGLGTESINSLAVDVSNASLVYAATNAPGSMKLSNNSGYNWSSISLPVTFYSLEASPNQAGVVYAGTSDGVYRYQSGGWTQMGLAGHTVTAVKLNPARPGLILAGTDQGAYFSADDGSTWEFVDDKLNGQTIESISVDPFEAHLAYFNTKTHGTLMVFIRF